MKYSFLLIAIITLVLFQSSAQCDQREDDVQRALTRLNNGIELIEQQDPRSTMVLNEAAALLADAIEQHDIQTPGIYHALGNAYMLNNDLGHAVLAYRKGEQIDPTDKRLSDSLSHARSIVPLSVEESASTKFWSIILLWRGNIPRNTLWLIFVSISTLGWIAISSRVLGFTSRSVSTAGIWLIVGSTLPLGMLGSEWVKFHGSPAAVITSTHVIARSGPDDMIYDPTFGESLQPGVEANILETRDSWTRLKLADGSECWVPTTSLEFINH